MAGTRWMDALVWMGCGVESFEQQSIYKYSIIHSNGQNTTLDRFLLCSIPFHSWNNKWPILLRHFYDTHLRGRTGEREVDAEGPPNKPNYHITLPYNICKTTTDDGEGKKTEGAFVPVYFDGISVQRFSARSAACTKFAGEIGYNNNEHWKYHKLLSLEKERTRWRERGREICWSAESWHNFFSIIASMDEVVWT